MYRNLLIFIAKYFLKLRIAFHDAIGLTGFVLFLTIYVQVVSGVVISFSYITESMNIPLSREEEDGENRYFDDFFLLHERGVDYIEFFLLIHLARKMFLNVSDCEQEFAWNTGVILFLFLQIIVFTGLVLTCTHLSDITLLVASNIFRTFCMFTGKFYWLLFTDQTLNSDTITSFGYIHFLLGSTIGGLTVYHGIDMHYDWTPDHDYEGINQQINWYDEALLNEISQTLDFLLISFILLLMIYAHPDTLSYELFTWGDVGMITDISFYGVAPHWYFRPYMSWLLVCPLHFTGIFGLVLFFIVLYFQPDIMGRNELDMYFTVKSIIINILWNSNLFHKTLHLVLNISPDFELFYMLTYTMFVVCLWYTFSYLPYGRFFNRIGGNDVTLGAYAFIFSYLSFPCLSSPGVVTLRNSLRI